MSYGSIINFVRQIKSLEDLNFPGVSIVMTYVGIDMMCRLSLPENEVRQTKQHFKRWVDTYMKAHPDQPYQYNSDELYAARCAVLHNYGSQANLHEKNEALKLIGYHDGGMHFVNENIDDRLVIIGTKSFINDFVLAVDRFLTDFGKDPQLKALVEKRLKDVFSIYPIS